MIREQNWFDPDLTPDEFRRLGYRVVDLIAEYYSGLRDRRIFPSATPEEIRKDFDEPLPEFPQEPDSILDAWTELILPNATHLGSPRYFGFVNGSGTTIGVLADALAASVNMNLGGWKASPAATEIERRTISWLAELIGYDSNCGGLFTSGGTMANYTGLLAALRTVAGYETAYEGLRADSGKRYLVYMSEHEGHVSILRAADMLNIGRNAVRRVPVRYDFTMDPDALEKMVKEDMARGDVPFCVVAQAGSINVGAIDPLEEIAGICREQGIWLHVDGACGAVGAMLPEKADLYRGMEQADSICLDPHKWMFIPYECGCVFVRNPAVLKMVFDMSAPYLRSQTARETDELNYFHLGPQMSRGFRALKVWMTLKHYGAEGYRQLLRQGIRCAEHFDRLVRASPDFEAIHHPTIYIYSFRYVPDEIQKHLAASSEELPAVQTYLDMLNQRIADEIRTSGFAFVMTSIVGGRTVLRLSICSHRTTLDDMDAVFSRMHTIGSTLHDNERVSSLLAEL